MDVLHLFDLHLSSDSTFTNLQELWSGPAGALGRDRRFDFIVISGDLTHAAGEDEYGALTHFLQEDLVEKRLKLPERRRIILVPGNHDVLWNADVLEPSPRRPDFRNKKKIAQILEEAKEVRRFVILSTGSLGAGAVERPGAVPNQFSTLRLFPTRVDFEVYGKRRGQWDAESTGSILIDLPDEDMDRRSRARVHRRIWTTGEDGIVRTEVELEGLEAGDAISLAAISPKLQRFDSGRVQLDGALSDVSPRPRQDGAVDVLLPRNHQRIGRVGWSFSVPNFLALNEADLRILDRSRASFPNLRDEQDMVAHTVSFDVDRLELELRFAEPPVEGTEQPSVTNPKVLVERKARNGEEGWSLVQSEITRCELERRSRHDVRMRVDAPIVGLRYGLTYEPSDPGLPLDRRCEDLARRLLERAQSTWHDPFPLAQALVRAIGLSARRFSRSTVPSSSGLSTTAAWPSPHRRASCQRPSTPTPPGPASFGMTGSGASAPPSASFRREPGRAHSARARASRGTCSGSVARRRTTGNERRAAA